MVSSKCEADNDVHAYDSLIQFGTTAGAGVGGDDQPVKCAQTNLQQAASHEVIMP
ncbi:hypothetical protein PCH70_45450 [Pseudomonas cichorii JBC1]|nr:hypothetical protein PCH70_45450 [Pseudomonas cichorii JBC1]